MTKVIKIAVDAMGGEKKKKKIIDGVFDHYKKNKKTFYQLFGNKEKIIKCIPPVLEKECYEIIHTDDQVQGTDTPLGAAKRGKNTSMWLAVDSVKKKMPI